MRLSGPMGDPKLYLDYLDKEMTIMGILSTFCVLAASVVIDKVAGAEQDKATLLKTLATNHPLPILAGSACLILAGLCFYLQRSTLASFYSGISMSMADPAQHEWDTSMWLREAYSWHTWLRYKNGFACLELAALLFSYVIYRGLYPQAPPRYWLWWILCAFIIIENARRAIILSVYRYESKPYTAFNLANFQKDWRERRQPL